MPSFLSLTRADLWETYQQFLDWTATQGIPGVLTLDTQQPGPEVGIMACTHGNEPAGLAAFRYLLHYQEALTRGRLHLILNNIEAARRYFTEATDLSFTAHYRLVDRDMNRLKPGWQSDGTYESQRVQQLLPLLERLDVVLDLHSTSAPSDPMLIEISESAQDFQVPGVALLIQNIVPHLNAPPLVSLCTGASAYVLETGSHEDQSALHIAQAAVQTLLQNAGVWGAETEPRQKNTTLLTPYRIYQTVVFPHESYRLTEIVPHLSFLPAGKVLAYSETEDKATWPDWVVERDSYAIMPPQRLKPVHFGSEFMYLAEKQP